MSTWKKIYTSSQLASAAIVVNLLNEQKVPAKILDKKDSAFVFMGNVEVYVPESFETKALAILDGINLDSIQA
ncbi:MAG: putative prokaryotic signal transducing protein [Bacteroidota bacterium]|jgi:hypothetical protein